MSRAEETLLLDIPLVLPEVESEQDQCIARLLERVQRLRGIRRAHVKRSNGQHYFCLHYDPTLLSLLDVRKFVEREGAAISDRYRHETLRVSDMDCADCALSIEHILGRMKGLLTVSVNYAGESMRVEYDSKVVSRDEIVKKVRQLGYTVELPEREPRSWLLRNLDLSMALAAGLFLVAGYATDVFGLLPRWAILLFYAVSYVAGGFEAAKHGLLALARLRLDVDFLMVLAAVSAAILGHYPEGALLLFLFSLGHSLERYAMQRARREIRALSELRPRTARVRRDGAELELPVEELVRGDIVVVRPGERIPADGVVRAGESEVDQSSITGESVPVLKRPGDNVFAGSVNGAAALEIEVTKLAHDTTLARIIQLVEQAQTRKAKTQRVAERFQRVYVPSVVGFVIALAILPPVMGLLPWKTAVLRAIAVLVAASPCALAIAVPATILAAVARAARIGVLVKGGVNLEALGILRAIAFDKTGTLTEGKPQLVRVTAFGGFSEDDALRLAASVECQSTHPFSRAVMRRVEELGLDYAAAEDVRSFPGKGIGGQLEGKRVLVGSVRFIEGELGRSLPPEVVRKANELASEGITPTVVWYDGTCCGILGFQDVPRREAVQSLRSLRELGMERLIILTGDTTQVATSIARRLGVDEVYAELLPEQKVEVVDRLVHDYGAVGMVGDGVNDAPAMARATVGIAVGAGGSDVALETADVALMANDLTRIPVAIALGGATRRTMRANLGIAMGVILALVPAAALGLAGIPIAILLHEGSTLVVVLNALRLLGFRWVTKASEAQEA